MRLAAFVLSFGMLVAAARAGDPVARDAMEPRQLAALTSERQPVVWLQPGWDEMGASLRRARQTEADAKARGKELSQEVRPAEPVNPMPGKCVPFKVPAPHKSMQDYCRALQRMPWKEADALFRKASAPAQWLGVRGCTVGCVIGNNVWSNMVSGLRFWGGSWNGKCITENPDGSPKEVLQALCPYCGGVNAPRSWADAMPADLMVPGVRVMKGKSWLDKSPAWVFNYDLAGRAYGFDFKGFRDELRQAAPGLLVGKMFMEASNATWSNGWNPSNRTTEMTSFVLMQTCASNGQYATRPIDRVAL